MLLPLLITELRHSCAMLLLGGNVNPNTSSRPGRMRETGGHCRGRRKKAKVGALSSDQKIGSLSVHTRTRRTPPLGHLGMR